MTSRDIEKRLSKPVSIQDLMKSILKDTEKAANERANNYSSAEYFEDKHRRKDNE